MSHSSESSDGKIAAHTAIFWILRVGVAGCFIGHGAFGIITKAVWVPYFAVGGIGEPLAWRLMPWVGTMDIALGVLALVWPCRALFLWAALWATWTALLRPLSGEPVWEFMERAGNFGVPFALLAIAGTDGPLFTKLVFHWNQLAAAKRALLAWTLRITTAALLSGHAGLGLIVHKAGLARHYAAVGVSQPEALVRAIGGFEFFVAALVLLRPKPGLLIGTCLWKIATESLFIVAGAPFWEVIERFGSYAAPLALAFLLAKPLSGSDPAFSPVTR